MSKDLPNFLIVGAAKSGTTSLYYYLKQHPEIYMSEKNKEPHFLVHEKFKDIDEDTPMAQQTLKYIVDDLEKYKKLFEDVVDEKMVGEASTGYLYESEESIKNIKKYLGDIKIIMILRNPIDRAYSAYSHLKKGHFENLSFMEALKAENVRKEEKWDRFFRYIDYGMYHGQVEQYKKEFTNVKVILFDDLESKKEEIVKETFEFLEVNSNFVPKMNVQLNATGTPRYQVITNFFVKPNMLKDILKPIVSLFMNKHQRRAMAEKIKNKNLIKTSMSEQEHAFLTEKFEDEISNLQTLINRDLSMWIKAEKRI